MSTEIELKPCPFCGGTPVITKHHKEEMWGFMHRCPVIGAVSWGFRESIESHAKDWNTRAE